MPIDRANTPYDPQDRRSRDFHPMPGAKYQPMSRPPPKPPKPGISGGLLAWVVVMVTLSVFGFLTLMMHFHFL